jgi:zinc-ribbon domain
MTSCTSCGAENADGTQFCTKCGATLSAPGPSTDYAPPPVSEYTPTGGAASYNPPQPLMQTPPQPAGEPPHPALAAVVSLFFPGMGLLFVPNKQRLGIGIFAGTVVGYVILIGAYILFSAVTLGFGAFAGCCFLLLPLWNLATAIHSYDEAAKISGGKFSPLVFK